MKSCIVPINEQEFNKNKSKKDGLNAVCRVCSKARSKAYYITNKETQIKQIYESRLKRRIEAVKFVRDYATKTGCIDCKENNFLVLDFDHVRGKKKNNISILIGNGASIQVIQEEIDKCDVRCANCHRIKTAHQQGWYSYLNGSEAY